MLIMQVVDFDKKELNKNFNKINTFPDHFLEGFCSVFYKKVTYKSRSRLCCLSCYGVGMCRQQSEVSTPNRDVWRVCGASGTRPQTVR
ncbi:MULTISPECIES: hypothetical protein [unclassified Gilliamella]|uniref:hypothetical protein n=1 Tax=unclassified Gilliamella TaxID=2685620 RepID=UPI0013256ABC|nr:MULTISPECIES: hypothetical protein [unclassified Gilliamella]MWN32201.1 hypothetical protein [Gilliamella sp. Pra-s60]MWP29477.1 hypothetical protein [Gilliamella sp. Pra-s54]